ncbi:hypothetical protein CSUI_008528 [Cystoisospora suis]|uniref:Transmembrane protein n=1 Tax=Cystoisospora suis TaxID=483139 RepID=A0A2C6KMC9_9APIC|nr:hypothetical protein CSUI_008528 [Cystoisospora suis]
MTLNWYLALGTLVTNIAQAAAQQAQQQQQLLAEAAAQPPMPSVAEQERIQAIQRAKMNQVSAAGWHTCLRRHQGQHTTERLQRHRRLPRMCLSKLCQLGHAEEIPPYFACSTYKQLEQDLAMPLAQKTSHLKAERLQLMRRISSLTREVRSAYDKLHPDMVDRPLIIVAKTADDDMRAVANRIDAQEEKSSIATLFQDPWMTYRESYRLVQSSTMRERHKRKNLSKAAPYRYIPRWHPLVISCRVVQSMNNLDEEARALSRMSPEERLTYGTGACKLTPCSSLLTLPQSDRNMSEEYGYKKEQLARDVKRAGKCCAPTGCSEALTVVLAERQAGIYRPTVLGTAISGVLGGLQAGTPFPTGRPPV